MVERKIKYLGHILTERLWCIDSERVQGILDELLARTKKAFFGINGVLQDLD